MKRGREEENSAGPMFPRLHVNDTAGKGGPRAPPRNKMALYEQLSVPAQRFGYGVVPRSSQNKPNRASSVSAIQQSESTTTTWSEKRHYRQPEATSWTVPVAPFEQRRRAGDEEELTIPMFVPARASKNQSKIQTSSVRETVSSLSSVLSKHNTTNTNLGRGARDGSKDYSKSRTDQSTVENADWNETKTYSVEECREDLSDYDRSSDEEARLHQKARDEKLSESKRDKPRSDPCVIIELESVEDGDDVPGTSMVDSDSSLDISPDEVAGIMGRSNFWKARKAIVHQQRLFAVQVFDLHRLIKVQKLIAGSPQIFLEDSSFPGKSSLKRSPALSPPESVLEPIPVVASPKNDSENPIHEKGSSTETTIEKTLSSTKNDFQPLNYGPLMGPPQMLYTGNDNKTSPQWVIPVMSPTEGLVYKPYAGLLPVPVYGGCGPYGNYVNSPYQVPAMHPQEIAGFSSFPYGMPMGNPAMSASTVDQASQLSEPMSTQKNQPVPLAKTTRTSSKGSDLQRGRGSGITHNINEKDALDLFPLAPAAQEGATTRVVKVVPHNRLSATESAARIFKFIQEERKQLRSDRHE